MAKKKRRGKIAASLALTPVGRRSGALRDITPVEPQFSSASRPTGPPKAAPRTAHDSKLDANALVSGPKLRRILDVSAVTLWRWRHSQGMEFPPAKLINGRMYFPWGQIAAWLEKQQEVA